MPKFFPRPTGPARLLAASGLVVLALLSPLAQAGTAASAPTPSNSDMDAPLFYQLLVGEMELRSGQPGVAFQVLLDAARRTSDGELYRRVINIALQARAGDQALIAARAWREAIPDSVEAHQMVIQLLVALNKPEEVVAPLRNMLAITPEPQRNVVLASIPRLFQRAPEPKRVYAALAPVLEAASEQPATRMMALLVQGRLALSAEQADKALSLTQTAAKDFPEADEPLLLALDLLPSRSEAESLITARLQAKPDHHDLRLAYGRALARAQRAADAAREFRIVTQARPDDSQPWYVLGALELDLRHPEAAEKALQAFLERLDDKDSNKDSRQQAWLLLAQAAEMRGDLKTAESWLARIDNPQRALEVTYRRASLMARQGQLAKGRALLQALPGERDEDARAKLMAESQLLRDARQWEAAHQVLAQANTRFPADADLIYEQAMMSEKLGRMDEMELLLRRVMEIKPEHYHAYNALGYSLAERNERLPEAKTLIAKALEYAPSEPFIVDSLGWVEYRMGNHAEALRLLRQAYQSRPDAEIAAHLGEVLWVSGQQEEARKVWGEGAKRDPKNEALRETRQRLKAGR
ncbi:tetratricopeptide repeat protein [Paucibacter sp. PLA-PC-4]|uniref:tetratricopeptide repeat protein n=1 Tax=Paucibacter sp. PLA-PC-4 TaxID=2993655 RepID=UPI00224B1AD1|nr:tetratricopeptide repeat protein [Paucibacter sp. PLA-PC-4]MCX2865616.1 tetratricopeptide repeat protein [Paucibacter sp. PLA-PC-4]